MSKQETYLVFRLREDPFVVPVGRVEEVLEYERPTVIPRAPDYLLGIVNVRGRLIPILDLRRRFEIPPTEITVSSRFVVLNLSWDGETVPLGILVDLVDGVVDLDTDTIAALPPVGRETEKDADTLGETGFLQGTARHGDSIYMVLDVDRILVNDTLHRDFASLSGGHS